MGKSARSEHAKALIEKVEIGPSHEAITAAVNEIKAQVELPEPALDAEARRHIGTQRLKHGQVSAKALMGSKGSIQDAVHDALATGGVNGVKGLLKAVSSALERFPNGRLALERFHNSRKSNRFGTCRKPP